MNTIIVWVIMTTSGHNGTVTFSPSFPTEAECVRVQKMIPHSISSMVGSKNECIKIETVR